MGRTHGKTTEEVLREVKAVHGDSLCYDKFNYVNANTKVTVGCAEHNYYFGKWPNDLKAGSGCPKCSGNYRKTHTDFKEEVKSLYPHITVIGTYTNAKTKIKFVCDMHKQTFMTKPTDILHGHSGCEICAYNKAIQSKIKSGQIVDPKYKSEYALYRGAVWRFSNKAYKAHLFEQTRDRHNHLDHVLSIVDGYNNLIPAEVVGSIHNLRIISAKDNQTKSYKSDITVEELFRRYNTCES